MTSAPVGTPPAQKVKWAAIGALGGLIIGLLVSLLVRAPIAVDSRVVVDRASDNTVHAMFLGDSLTTSQFASSEAAGFRPLVISGMGVPVTEVPGNDPSATLSTVASTIVVPPTTNLVVVELGNTDVYVNNITTADFTKDFDAVITRVTAQAPQATIVCLGIWGTAAVAANYDPSIAARCQQDGGAFVQLADLYEAPGIRGPAGESRFGGVSDEFHPNDVGYSAIAQRVLGILKVAKSSS